MGRPCDDFADLAAAIERGALSPSEVSSTGARTFEHMRREFTVDLGTWERMLEQLLAQLAEDAGSRARALVILGAPSGVIRAWLEGPTQGTRASVQWLAEQGPDSRREIGLRVVKVRRGDSYADLADSARSFRLRGDGKLDAARLRPSYTIELRHSWLRMVGDLLGQVVADAGEREQAARILGVKPRTLTRWIRWLVSRGSLEGARASWPVAVVAQIDGELPFDDLAGAVLRGALESKAGAVVLPVRELREFYRVKLATWGEMEADLLGQIAEDAGSIRKAAVAIGLPRTTFAARLKRARGARTGIGGFPESSHL